MTEGGGVDSSRHDSPEIAGTAAEQPVPGPAGLLARRHLRLGWWMLLVFLSLGIALESLHGFKIAWYLDVANETRRHLWTLAHAHGTLLGLVHIAFATTVSKLGTASGRWRVASTCLIAAAALLPGGFFLGGFGIQEGDPGLGILLVPAGAVALLCGVLLVVAAMAPRR